MHSSSREQIVETFDALHDVVFRLGDLTFDALTSPERLSLLARLEDETRRLPVARHELINGAVRTPTATCPPTSPKSTTSSPGPSAKKPTSTPDPGLSTPPQGRRPRLDHPQTQRRPHRMDSTTSLPRKRGDSHAGQPRVNIFHHPEKLPHPKEAEP